MGEHAASSGNLCSGIYTVNVDIFACINVCGFMKMGKFTRIIIHILGITGSIGYFKSIFHSVYTFVDIQETLITQKCIGSAQKCICSQYCPTFVKYRAVVLGVGRPCSHVAFNYWRHSFHYYYFQTTLRKHTE